MVMQTLPSVEVKNKFGQVARAVNQGEPVTVTQYGESTMMILPYQLAKEALRVYKAQKLIEFMDAMPPAYADAPELTEEEITALVHEYRT